MVFWDAVYVFVTHALYKYILYLTKYDWSVVANSLINKGIAKTRQIISNSSGDNNRGSGDVLKF